MFRRADCNVLIVVCTNRAGIKRQRTEPWRAGRCVIPASFRYLGRPVANTARSSSGGEHDALHVYTLGKRENACGTWHH